MCSACDITPLLYTVKIHVCSLVRYYHQSCQTHVQELYIYIIIIIIIILLYIYVYISYYYYYYYV